MTDEIYILSGEIHSGKTTRLLQWAQKRDDVFGILSPVINGTRYFMNAETKELFPMETSREEQDVLKVGKYTFSADGFKKAIAVLRSVPMEKEGWLVIDEIGPLELKGEGFSEAVKEILSQKKGNHKIVIVIRKNLLEDIVFFFGIKHHRDFIFG